MQFNFGVCTAKWLYRHMGLQCDAHGRQTNRYSTEMPDVLMEAAMLLSLSDDRLTDEIRKELVEAHKHYMRQIIEFGD